MASLLMHPVTVAAQVTRLDLGPGGALPTANASGLAPVISADGRYTAFVSRASNLVPGDGDGLADFFRYDRLMGQLVRGDAGPDAEVALHAISHDGRWLLFTSAGSQWVAGDTNGAGDAFQYEFGTGLVRRVSVGTGGIEQVDVRGTFSAGMSADGRYVAFESSASNLAPASLDNGTLEDVFVHDTVSGETVQVSRGAGNVPANAAAILTSFSGDGDWVALLSRATNIQPSDGPVAPPGPWGDPNAYVVHWQSGHVRRVPLPPAGGANPASDAQLGWDAQNVLVRGFSGQPGRRANYVWTRLSDATVRAEPNHLSLYEGGRSALSQHGRYVAWTTTGPEGFDYQVRDPGDCPARPPARSHDDPRHRLHHVRDERRRTVPRVQHGRASQRHGRRVSPRYGPRTRRPVPQRRC